MNENHSHNRNTRTRTQRTVSFAATTTVAAFAGLATSSLDARAATTCPSIAAVSAAVGSAAVKDEHPFGFSDCAFKVGDTTVSFTITPATDVAAALAANRADATRRTAGVKLIKVGRYKAFTGTASGVSQLFYDQKGTTVFVSHQQIDGNSAGIIKRVSTAVSIINIPKKITSCALIDRVVAKVEPTAIKQETPNSGCSYKYADESLLAVGTYTDDTFSGWLESYRSFATTGPVKDANVGTHKGFVYQTSGTNLVIGLADAVALVETNEFLDQTPFTKLTAARAAAALG